VNSWLFFKSRNLWQKIHTDKKIILILLICGKKIKKYNSFAQTGSKKENIYIFSFLLLSSFKKMEPDKKLLIKLAHTKMPFGKYEGRFLIDLPEYYVVWYHNKGFPNGELGQQLALIYELKLNGLEELIRNIKKQYPKPLK